MNFIDAYDVSGPSTPLPGGHQRQPSLNEEVGQVIGSLGRFWGDFRRQSQSALESARKDFGQVVSQAQQELSKLGLEPSTSSSSVRSIPESTEEATREVNEVDADGSDETPLASPSPEIAAAAPTSSRRLSLQTFIGRLQSVIPPNVVNAVQANIPEGVRHATDNVDLVQLRNTLSNEFHRVQGVTKAQAEEYLHKSEEMFREAWKDAEVVIKDAVKIIPPEQAGSSSAELIWDGSDMWMLPSASPEGADKGPTRSDTPRSVATRAEALLGYLRTDPEIIKRDPGGEASISEMYSKWSDAEWEEAHGFQGEKWKAQSQDALADATGGSSLKATFDCLVPSSMHENEFWKRYFFRVYQIHTEEEKRKALLQASLGNEEDISWEEEDEDDQEVPEITKSVSTLTPERVSSGESSADKDVSQASGSTSRRVSSDASYDVVSGNVSSVPDDKEVKESPTKEDSDADSDWE
ncbi:hypothetical protein FISHEDRAFT_65535 [Fistulina hepatica ATCC 64428]|uniref:BSD domain-containing protein n=1 Tax=Fistulina hepatica ATCC 64428 TaxID=1128425 RepID=A0A0D7AEF4_9AGAR|nr:hypothetical protein FISHEDRAFT_65535 [Fistulina hepatica ATCC 64428]